MARLINIPRFDDERGSLCVIEDLLPFVVKRFYYIFNVKSERGGHRHKLTRQALICLSGSCEIFVDNGKYSEIYILENPDECLLVEPDDWHTMSNFSYGSTLLVIASELFDKNDYIHEPYIKKMSDDRI